MSSFCELPTTPPNAVRFAPALTATIFLAGPTTFCAGPRCDMEVFVRIAWVGRAFSSLVRVRLAGRRVLPACVRGSKGNMTKGKDGQS